MVASTALELCSLIMTYIMPYRATARSYWRAVKPVATAQGVVLSGACALLMTHWAACRNFICYSSRWEMTAAVGMTRPVQMIGWSLIRSRQE